MKKLSSVLLALLPLLYVAVMLTAAKINMGDELFLGSLGIYAFLGLLFPIVYCVTSTKAEQKFWATNNIWFYAGNLVLFIAEIVFWFIRLEENRIAEQNGAMEGGLGLALLILVYLPHWFSYLFTRIAGAISCARTLNGECVQGVIAFHTFLQIFPGTDLISSIWVYRKVKQNADI